MGKPDIQVVKATLVYDGVAHDIFANRVGDLWFATHDKPAENDAEVVASFLTASEAIGYLAADIVQRVGLVIA